MSKRLRTRAGITSALEKMVGHPGGAIDDSTTEMVKLSAIDEHDQFRARAAINEKHVERLAESIRRDGQLNAIILRAKGGGRFDLIAGYHRKRALEMNGAGEARARVLELDDEAAKRVSVFDNEGREPLTERDRLSLVRRWLHEGDSLELIADRFGWGKRTAQLYSQVLQTPAVASAVEEERLSLSSGVEVARAADLYELGSLIDAAASRSRREVKQITKIVKVSPQLFEAVQEGVLSLPVAVKLLASVEHAEDTPWRDLIRAVRGARVADVEARVDEFGRRRGKRSRANGKRSNGGVRWSRPISDRGFALNLSYRAGGQNEVEDLESIIQALDQARRHARSRLKKLSS